MNFAARWAANVKSTPLEHDPEDLRIKRAPTSHREPRRGEMSCAAFASSPGEGRNLLKGDLRQGPRASVICRPIASRDGKPCRKSIPMMSRLQESGRIVTSMRSRDRFPIRCLPFSSLHSPPRSCSVIFSLTSSQIFHARKTACCRAPKIARPPNCRPTDNLKKLRQLSSEGFERVAERSPPGVARRPSVATSRIHCLLGFAG